MKLLLDTHIWIWTLLKPQKLGRRVAREVASLRNDIWLSPVSVWEALLLAENGHIRIPEGPQRFFEAAVAGRGYQEAVLTHEVAFESRRLGLSTEDPADRFLNFLGCVAKTKAEADGRRINFGRAAHRQQDRRGLCRSTGAGASERTSNAGQIEGDQQSFAIEVWKSHV